MSALFPTQSVVHQSPLLPNDQPYRALSPARPFSSVSPLEWCFAPINPRLAQSRSLLEDKQKKLMMLLLAFATALFIMINELMVFVDYGSARPRYLFQLSVLKVAKPRLAPPHAHNPFPLAMIQWGDMASPASRRLTMMRSLLHSFRCDDWLTPCFSQGTRHRSNIECVAIRLRVDECG